MKYFVIADTHFGHSNVIRYCNRPFKDAEEMNRVLIKNWNEVVSNQDKVLLLGDFCLTSREEAAKIVDQLSGRKILIKGNHDCWSDDFYRSIGFEYVSKFPIVYNDFFLMSHAPLQLSDNLPYFSYYGHVHNDMKYQNTANSMCVSVERIGYRPYKFLEK